MSGSTRRSAAARGRAPWLMLIPLLACRESVNAEAAPANAAPNHACGSAGQPDCPTQRWMKATVQSHLRTRDFKRLGTALDTLAARAPKGFEGWEAIAAAGAQAATVSDEVGVRRSCQECHVQHRARFQKTRRAEELL